MTIAMMHPTTKDYKVRAHQYGFATPEQVVEALLTTHFEEHAHAGGHQAAVVSTPILLDVRSVEEIEEQNLKGIPNVTWTMSRCTPMACPNLEEAAEKIVGPAKDTTIVVYCASGRRAAKAKQILQDKGYTHVMNAGGVQDLNFLKTVIPDNQ